MSLYLDYNASAPILKDSADAVIDCLKNVGNPSSVHRSGRKVKAIIENSRQKIASMIGISSNNIIFTSGATEANFLAMNASNNMRAILSSIEHPSVLSQRNDALLIPVDKSGVVSLDQLEKILYNNQSEQMFISVMLVNNETGVIQPIEEII
ncbi:MAG: putative cysteine desulfurase NifS, partial [Alphaproteobacteria bacterium MarineAlpha9_Bin2]